MYLGMSSEGMRDEDVRVAFTEDLTVSTDATVVRIPADAGLTSSMSHCSNVEIMSTVTLYLPFHILVVLVFGSRGLSRLSFILLYLV